MSFTNYLEDENDKPYFTTNSLAYYYDKMEGFAKAVEGSAKALNLTKEEVEKRLTLYIEQNKNELDQRLAQWDGKLETFDSSVETLLTEWVDDGTLNTIIDSTLIDQKVAPLSQQLVDTAVFESNKDVLLKRLPITPKAVYNQAGVVMVVSRKPHGNGFIRFKLRDNQFTTNVSVGAPAELMRVVEVFEVAECFSFLNKEASLDDPASWQVLSVNYTQEGVGQQAVPVRSTVNRAVGRWIEYSVNIPTGVNEVVALIYKTTGSSTSVDISVNGVPTLTGQSFAGTGFERIVIPVGKSGRHTIRFTANTVQHINIAGVNVVDIQNFIEGYDYDNLLSLVKTSTNQYVTSDGAMEYALLNADTDLWCGSVHGGEVRSRLQYIVDGKPITLNDGQVKIGRVVEVEQDTRIVNKINAYSTQRFEGDGSVEHETIFDGDINLKTLFTNMGTVKDNFEEITYPLRKSMVGQDRIYLPQGINYVVQRNLDTMQKMTTIMNNKKFPVNEVIVPYVKKTVGAYNKLYNANIQSTTGVRFTGGHFKTSHIFE